jgi:hypothetical protein
MLVRHNCVLLRVRHLATIMKKRRLMGVVRSRAVLSRRAQVALVCRVPWYLCHRGLRHRNVCH